MGKVVPIWNEDTPVYIIGGGPSVNDFPLYRIKDRIIVCNNAHEILPHADVHIAFDRSWHDDYADRLKSFGGLKFRCPQKVEGHDPSAIVLQRKTTGELTLDEPDKLAHCRHHGAANTGHSAIDLAVKLGSKKIRLVGFDMKVDATGAHNWHQPHRRKVPDKNYQTKYYYAFEMMKPSLDSNNVEVLNLNLNSGLDMFEKVDYETIL